MSTTNFITPTARPFRVSANGATFGVFEAETEQRARDACAMDAGYKSEADMCAQLEQPSALVATATEPPRSPS